MTPEQFVEKWSRADLSERAASHEHFIDLCQLLGHPLAARRAEVDQVILQALLDLNHRRALGASAPPARAAKGKAERAGEKKVKSKVTPPRRAGLN